MKFNMIERSPVLWRLFGDTVDEAAEAKESKEDEGKVENTNSNEQDEGNENNDESKSEDDNESKEAWCMAANLGIEDVSMNENYWIGNTAGATMHLIKWKTGMTNQRVVHSKMKD